MEPVVSIIVPVYNAENYLCRCLDSLCSQTLKEIEIICVNDGSTDNSLDILNEYKNKDFRIKIITQKNQGPSAARNTGINNSMGTYIGFVDADDCALPEMYEKLSNCAITNACQVVACGNLSYPTYDKAYPGFSTDKPMSFIESLKTDSTPTSNNSFSYCWRFLYQKKHLEKNNIRFLPGIHIAEDAIFNMKALLSAEKIFSLHETLYVYSSRTPNSIMRTKYKPFLEESLNKQYIERKKLSEEYGLFDITTYKDDFYGYCRTTFLAMMIKNLYANDVPPKRKDILRILNYPVISEAYKTVTLFQLRSKSWNFIYFIAAKYKFTGIIMWLIKRKKIVF